MSKPENGSERAAVWVRPAGRTKASAWTTDDLSSLRLLLATGASNHACAQQLGTTVDRVKRRIEREPSLARMRIEARARKKAEMEMEFAHLTDALKAKALAEKARGKPLWIKPFCEANRINPVDLHRFLSAKEAKAVKRARYYDEAPKPKPVKRKCLTCNESFVAEGRFIRLCDCCRRWARQANGVAI